MQNAATLLKSAGSEPALDQCSAPQKGGFLQRFSRVDFFCAASVPGGDTPSVHDTVVYVSAGKTEVRIQDPQLMPAEAIFSF